MATRNHKRRLLRRYAVTVAFALPLTAIASTASTIQTQPDQTSLGAGAGADRAVTAAMHEPRPAKVAHRLRSVGHHRLPAASPKRKTWTPVDLNTLDIPATAMQAYQLAAFTLQKAAPACHLTWTLLAAIGRIESDHGRFGGATLGANGISTPLIRGVPLNGKNGVARIPDTDNGRLDGNKRWDLAVGPMQFLPSTWAYVGVDANGDGVRNPYDINDAALAAGVYLCAAGGDLGSRQGTARAVYRYNNSSTYVAEILQVAHAYKTGHYQAPTMPVISTVSTGSLQVATIGAAQRRGPGGAQGRHSRAHHAGKPGKGTGHTNGHGKQPGTKGGSTPSGQDPQPTSPPSNDPQPTNPPSNNPQPTSPPSNDPQPTNPPTPTPQPTDPPAPTPQPTDPPTCPAPVDPTPTADLPVPAPALTELTGTLTICSDGVWMVGDTPIDVGDSDWLATTALNDLDGDNSIATNLEELTGLVGTEVVVGVADLSQSGTAGSSPLPVLYTVNALDYRDTGTTQP